MLVQVCDERLLALRSGPLRGSVWAAQRHRLEAPHRQRLGQYLDGKHAVGAHVAALLLLQQKGLVLHAGDAAPALRHERRLGRIQLQGHLRQRDLVEVWALKQGVEGVHATQRRRLQPDQWSILSFV